MSETTGIIVTSSPLTHKGVAKSDITGLRLVRVSATLTFESRASGQPLEQEVTTHILIDAAGNLRPGEFTETEGLAELRADDEKMKQEEFSVEPLFELESETFDAEILEGSTSATLMSATAQLLVLSDVGKTDKTHKNGLALTLYAVVPASGATLTLISDRAVAGDAYQKLMQGQPMTVTLARRRRSP